jgi:hypothetical protein
MADGINAYYLLLSSEYKPGTKRNCDDIACIISAYAPSTENDTVAYINQVTEWTQEYQCQILGITESVVIASTSTNPPAPTISTTVAPSPKPTIIEGQWEGAVNQPGAPYYTTILILEGCKAINSICGTVDYPELYCSGEITFLYERRGIYHFIENITNDTGDLHCAPQVNIELQQIDGNLWNITYNWVHKDESGSAEATLTKTK